jgi:hypothetical protein
MGKSKCFKNTTVRRPFSCTVPSFNTNKGECLRDLGGIGVKNHEEVKKVMSCIVTR